MNEKKHERMNKREAGMKNDFLTKPENMRDEAMEKENKKIIAELLEDEKEVFGATKTQIKNFAGPGSSSMAQSSAVLNRKNALPNISVSSATKYGIAGAADSLTFKQQQRRDAWECLEQSRHKSVAFAVRTNVAYDGTMDDDSPVHGRAVSFGVKEFLHIREKYNEDWWIGRLIKEGCDIGFIPSPAKLESVRRLQYLKRSKLTKGTGNDEMNNDSLQDDDDDFNFDFSNSKDNNTNNAVKSPALINPKERRKNFFRKQDHLEPYEVVPLMRPVVIVGPSLKGYEVTDMMQKAIFDHLKKKFEGRIMITHVTADISLAKRSLVGSMQTLNAAATAANAEASGRNNGRGPVGTQGAIGQVPSRLTGIAEVVQEIQRIFELARSMQLLVLDCDTINHPSQLVKTALAPLIVHLKISSPKVLQRLIKARGKSQSRHLNVQLVTADKLAQCPTEMFDLILEENQLDDACMHLDDFLESYWQTTHPPLPSPTHSPPAHNIHQPQVTPYYSSNDRNPNPNTSPSNHYRVQTQQMPMKNMIQNSSMSTTTIPNNAHQQMVSSTMHADSVQNNSAQPIGSIQRNPMDDDHLKRYINPMKSDPHDTHYLKTINVTTAPSDPRQFVQHLPQTNFNINTGSTKNDSAYSHYDTSQFRV
ncbi:hypothetical protein SNEBB_009373 [Seison nebaliae]|nr:hypothetical protein SNEBB_009373 [Seison nebaliae]